MPGLVPGLGRALRRRGGNFPSLWSGRFRVSGARSPRAARGSQVSDGDRDRDRDRGWDPDRDPASPPGAVPLPPRPGSAGHTCAPRAGRGFIGGPAVGFCPQFCPEAPSPKCGAMTSLAEQLKRLALPQNDPSLLDRSEVASLLFTCKEAATIDRDTFFAIGEFGRLDATGFYKQSPQKNSWGKKEERQTRIQ